MKHLRLIKIIFFLFTSLVFGQSDKLITEIDSLIEYSFKIRKKNPEQARLFARDAFNKSKKNNYKNGISLAYRNISICHYYDGQLDSAIINELKALRYFEESNDYLHIAGSFNRLGLYQRKNKDLDKAREYYKKALNYYEQIEDLNLISKVINNLAVVSSLKNDFIEAKEYYIKSLRLKEKLNDQKGIARIYNNLGNINTSINNYDEALKNYNNSLNIKLELCDTIGIITSFTNIASIYSVCGNYKKAIKNNKKALELVDKLKNYKLKLVLYNNLCSAYQKLGDYYNTFEYFHLHTLLKDSLYTLEKDKQIAEIREEYETEKKDQTISKQQLEIEKSETEKWLLILIIGFVSLTLVLIVVGYIQKKRANKILKIQKNDISRINTELKSVNKTKDKLFSIIAHDIRSPIISLQNMTDLLDLYIEEEDIESYLKTIPDINRSVKHLNLMMENLFNWSITQRGKLKTNKTEFDFYGLIISCIELQKISAEVKDITISVNEFDDEYIVADINMMRSVLNNLISNAIKFTPIGGKIDIELKKNENEFVFKISDSGCGIEEEKIKTLFNLDEKKIKSGTNGERGVGLGLVMTKEFLEHNNGSISVESTIDSGAAFTVKLKKEKVKNLQLV